MNSSVSDPLITFTVYSSAFLYNVAFAICVFLVYISILCVNLLLVIVICAESRLHRPMYILLVNLAVSGMVGASCVCLSIIKNLLMDKQQTSLQGCFTQVFFTNIYGGCIYCILALMAYDRYVSICKPLQYHNIMTPTKVKLLLVLVYFILALSTAVQVYLTSRLELCRHTVDKLLCDTISVSRLSCETSSLLSMYGLCCVICVFVLPILLVILSYVHIFIVIVKTSKGFQSKALHTCTPHLVTFINFSAATFFGFIYNRLGFNVPVAVSVLIYFNFSVVPSILHPIIYGIKMQEIRLSISKMMTKKIMQ
ncbi:odorant receptor, family 60, subfamily A, member 1 [Genypterus blacodes]|uniref:odorant receptor, family 60, subfamily A, member 1 n=1 Tax=Genypterus blacodes TaxID=154954 RepID=UPI003F75A377